MQLWGTWAPTSKSGTPSGRPRVGLGRQVHPHRGAASLECPLFLQHSPARRRSWKTLPRKSDRGALASGWHRGPVASLRAGSVTLTQEILSILQGSQQCSITIYRRSKLGETISLHNQAPVSLGGAKEDEKRS